MEVILFIAFHVIMMAVFFVVGIDQFSQIEDKRKRDTLHRLRATVPIDELGIDEGELRALVRDERYHEAIQHLMTVAEVDRFTAESAIENLKKQEYRPYHSAD